MQIIGAADEVGSCPPPLPSFFDIGFTQREFPNLWLKSWVVPQICVSFRQIIVTFLLCCQSFSRFYKIRFYLCTHLTQLLVGQFYEVSLICYEYLKMAFIEVKLI